MSVSIKVIFGVLLFIMILSNCNYHSKNNSFFGTYEGFWSETFWQYKFYHNNTFTFKSEGHFGNVDIQGKFTTNKDSLFLSPLDSNSFNLFGVINKLYLIDGDSCIIDHELKYDYCKTREYSIQRNFKYPQIQTSSIHKKESLDSMLQIVLNSKKVDEQIENHGQNLIMKEYFTFNNKRMHNLNKFGKPVNIFSENEINLKGIKNYVIIEDINLSDSSASFHLKINPIIPGNSILLYFNNLNGKWEKEY